MPFSGPEGQGPFEDLDECVEAMSDEEGIDDPEALCAFWEELDKTNQANAMTEPTDDEVQYRAYHQANPRDIGIQADGEGLMVLRMPIASTGEVRNEGDEPLTRDELDGMARQINERDVGVFLAHGDSTELTGVRYGQTERLGNWQDAEVMADEERDDGDGSDLLMAEAAMPDPETLPNDVARFREVLGILKEQAKRGIGMSASIGWREDEAAPGGNDLMEASIVGIPADPRTVTQDAPAVAVARAAVDAGADPEALVEAVREAVIGDTDRESDALDHTLGPTVGIEMATDQPLEEGELYCGPTDAVYDGFTLSAEIDCPGCGRTLDGLELASDLNDSGKPRLSHDMTDSDDTEPDAEQAEGTDGTEQTERQEAPEWAERMLELQQETNDTLQTVAEAVRQEDDDEEDDEDDQATDEDDEEEDEEQSADVTADQRAALETLRDGGFDVDDLDLPEPEEPDDEARDADTGDEDPSGSYNKYGLKPT